MGSTNYVYVGAYAFLTIPETTGSYNRYGCVNEKCKRFERSQVVKYCNCCGDKLGTYTVEVLEHLEPAEFLDKEDEDIFLFWMEGRYLPEGHYIAMINEEIPQIAINIDTFEEERTEVAIPSSQDSMYEFDQKYQKQLNQFEEHDVGVEIKYGIVNYFL